MLLFGSFPPVPGPATDATVAAARAAWSDAAGVTTLAARAGAAEGVCRLIGPLAGLRLEQARRRSGADRFVLILDSGVPFVAVRYGTRALQALVAWGTALGLAVALRRFAEVAVVLAVDPGVTPAPLRRLWPGVDAVAVAPGCEALADRLGVPAALRRPLEGLVALDALAALASGVTVGGPPEVPAVDMPRWVVGQLARRLFGRRFMWVRHRLLVAANSLRSLARRQS
ncbi:MAG: hypothetical protein ACYC1D_01465 [Acidimicrobiales bacterium]